MAAATRPPGVDDRDSKLEPVPAALGAGLVPVVIHDAPARWPARTFDFRPGTLRAEVLAPILTSHWTAERVAEQAQQVHDAFVERLPEHQRPLAS